MTGRLSQAIELSPQSDTVTSRIEPKELRILSALFSHEFELNVTPSPTISGVMKQGTSKQAVTAPVKSVPIIGKPYHVKGKGFRCVAYLTDQGEWRSYYGKNDILAGPVIIEQGLGEF